MPLFYDIEDALPPARTYPEEGIPGPIVLDERQKAFLRDPLSAMNRGWMYSQALPHRKTGRTFVLAIWHILRAWNEDLDQRVILVDHSSDDLMYDQVLAILRRENIVMSHGSDGPWILATKEMKENPRTWDDVAQRRREAGWVSV